MKAKIFTHWRLALAASVAVLLAPLSAFAHEVYVLPQTEVAEGLTDTTVHPFAALIDSGNIRTTVIIVTCVLLVLVLNFYFQHSKAGTKLSTIWTRFRSLGPALVRVAVAVSFLYSASSMSFLGPELPLSLLPYQGILQIALYAIGFLFLFGLLTRYAAIASIIIFAVCVWKFHWYMLTYMNYFGEFAVLALFGAGAYSLDRLLFHSNPDAWINRYRRYETLIIRVLYGGALLFAAINIKFLHAILTLDVVNNYNLTRFHFLFPHDPLLTVLGAGLAEAAIAIFIIVGFELRFTVLVSLFYITLSLLFFKELVWPHYILYGVSLCLLVMPSAYTLDSLFGRKWLARRAAAEE